MTIFQGFRDPRDYQIAVLASLLAYGLLALDFDVRPGQVPLTLGTVLATQWICTRVFRRGARPPEAAANPRGPLNAATAAAAQREPSPPPHRSPRFDPKSALISGLSLCLLLRAEHLWLVFAASVFAVASKFLIRVRGKHVFNPTNGAIVALLVASLYLDTGHVWVSPGQWGNVAFFAFLMACLGGLVVHRALRSDVTYAFIVAYGALLFGRSLWLGEPMTIPVHRLQSGALLLFTFFMISDPRTTPDSRLGRLLFAGLVAYGAWYVQFRLFRTNGLLWSLAIVSLLTPLIDIVLPGRRYEWPGRRDAALDVRSLFAWPRLWVSGRLWTASERTSS